MLTFDEPTHTYRWQGRVVPSVTQVLDSCLNSFAFVAENLLEAARDRGTYVHQLCELSDLGELDDDAERDGEHWKRLLAWRKFCSDYGANWSAIETRGYSARFGYAGTVDRRGKLERHTGTRQWIIDIKSSASKSKSWGMQLAAYRQIATEEDVMSWALARRGTVQLLENGNYVFEEFTNPKDWDAFASILTILDWIKS